MSAKVLIITVLLSGKLLILGRLCQDKVRGSRLFKTKKRPFSVF